MMNAKLLRGIFMSGGGALCLLGAMACNGGDTDGGTASEDMGGGSPFISDGGAGATLTIRLHEEEIGVGDTAPFEVLLRDPQGAPIEFIRIFCESERGIAIIEPSSGGVAFESTGPDGNMSGVLGGVTPGSFMLECRAQQGFNLYDRVRVKITGDVPAGFQGFPGAAGGNLGGGVIVDQTPDVDDGFGLRVSGIQFIDAGGETSVGPLDFSMDPDCDNDVDTVDPEPFTYTQYKVTVTNDTEETVFVESVQFTIRDSGSASETSRQTQTLEIAAGESKAVNGILTTLAGGGCTTPAGCYSGGTNGVEQGTFNGTVAITGRSVNDTSFAIDRNFTIQWDVVNNCSA